MPPEQACLSWCVESGGGQGPTIVENTNNPIGSLSVDRGAIIAERAISCTTV